MTNTESSSGFKNRFMALAAEESKKAVLNGDVPVGAVIVKDNKVIASSHNMREAQNDPTAHAEILAIRKAAEKLCKWRLSECDIYVTLEPCPMCASAIIQARLRRLYFGAYDKENGAASHNANNLSWKNTEVYCGIDEDICSRILTDFFAESRKNNSFFSYFREKLCK